MADLIGSLARGRRRRLWPWTATRSTRSPRGPTSGVRDEAWKRRRGRIIGQICANGTATDSELTGRRMGVAAGFEREVATMIDSVLNLLFRCPHKRRTRPVTPISMDG